MIQTEKLDCPSCGGELLDPIYDLEMVDGGRRRLTCGECGRPFTVTASLVYDVTADGEPAASPLADAVLAAFRLTDGGTLRVGGPGGRLARGGLGVRAGPGRARRPARPEARAHGVRIPHVHGRRRAGVRRGQHRRPDAGGQRGAVRPEDAADPRRHGSVDRRAPPDLAERYREAAVRFGRALAGDGYGAYVLDLCLVDGEVSIVELNGMMNAGLFALDMDALTRAMRARPDRFVPVSLDGLLSGRDACPVPV